jgi:hypothetical protein
VAFRSGQRDLEGWKAIERELMPKGFVLRYRTEETTDGLSGEEGVFLPCGHLTLISAAYVLSDYEKVPLPKGRTRTAGAAKRKTNLS